VRFVFAAVSLFALLGSVAVSGAENPLVFEGGLDLVKVTVTVRNEKGALVSDLKPEDFILTEDGRPQTLDLFARAADPETEDEREKALTLDLGLLLDTSSSMEPVLRLSQQAAIRFLDSVPRSRDLLTIFFDRDIRISRYDSEHQQGLFERILSTRGADMTALYDAVTVYLTRAEESTGRKVLVIFSDGQDTASEVKLNELMEMVRSSGVTIYSIGLQAGTPTNLRVMAASAVLRKLAEVTGGGAYFPTSYRELPGIYEHILGDLGAQYVLGFESTNKTADGKYRKIKVQVKRPGLRIVHREGYYGPAAPAAAAAK
jgi:Ca-activated chloride channel family protein